ncbi:hypothetical protein B0G75_103370 [Paraburkholderia sp. BL18I3N2]|nr:hypothetical protein B0G75_103370 [Paraburkholderia sp. BL18I3N2]
MQELIDDFPEYQKECFPKRIQAVPTYKNRRHA